MDCGAGNSISKAGVALLHTQRASVHSLERSVLALPWVVVHCCPAPTLAAITMAAFVSILDVGIAMAYAVIRKQKVRRCSVELEAYKLDVVAPANDVLQSSQQQYSVRSHPRTPHHVDENTT